MSWATIWSVNHSKSLWAGQLLTVGLGHAILAVARVAMLAMLAILAAEDVVAAAIVVVVDADRQEMDPPKRVAMELEPMNLCSSIIP